MYALELCSAAIQPAQENERLFLLLVRSLAYLCYSEAEPRRVTAVFLMGMTSLLGFRPQVGRCAQCGKTITWEGLPEDTPIAYFGAEAGGVLCEHCGAMCCICRQSCGAVWIRFRRKQAARTGCLPRCE